MSASRRRRLRDVFTSYCTPAICCQISVTPFTVKLEHWQKAVRTMRACFAIALDTQMKHGGVKAKVFSRTILWKRYLMLKVSYGTSLEIRLIKWMVQWKISTACTVITAYKVAKYAIKAYKNIVSTKNLSQHFECLVKMRATSSTLFVRVNTGILENAGMENAKLHWKTRNRHASLNSTLNKNIWHILPVSLSLKLSIRHFATNTV